MAQQKPASGTVLSTQRDDPRVKPGTVLSTDINDPRLEGTINIEPALRSLSPSVSPETAKMALDIGLPTLGSTFGATIGARRGPTGAYAGAGAGGAAGELSAMALYPALGLPLPPPAEAASRLATSAAAGATGEFGAQKVIGLGRNALSSASRRLTPTVRWAAEQLRQPVQYSPVVEGIRSGLRAVPGPTRWFADAVLPPTAPVVTPGQIPGTSFYRVGENIAEGSFFGSGPVSKIKKQQGELIEQRAAALQGPRTPNDALGRLIQSDIGRTTEALAGQAPLPSAPVLKPTELGQAIQQGLTLNKDAWFDLASQQFARAKELGLPDVPLDDVKAFAQEQLKSEFAPEAMGKLLPTLKRIAAAGEDASSVIGGTPGPGQILLSDLPPQVRAAYEAQWGVQQPLKSAIDAKSAEDLASHLKALIREDPKNEKMRGAAQQLLARLERSMEQVGEELAPEAREAFTTGRRLWREGFEKFRTQFLEQTIDQYPSAVADQLLKLKPEQLMELKGAIPKEAWQRVEDVAMQRLAEKAPSAAAIQKEIARLGPEKADMLLGLNKDRVQEYVQRVTEAEADRLLRMAKADPSTLASSIRRRSVEDLSRLKRTVSPETAKALEQNTLESLLRDGDELAPVASIEERLRKLTPEKLSALTGAQTQQSLKELLDIMKAVTPKADSRGRMFIQLTQSGAAIRTAQTLALGAIGQQSGVSPQSGFMAGAVLLGPAMMGKIMTSPAARNWLIQGIKAPPGSKMAVRAANELMAFVGREGLEDTSLDPTKALKVDMAQGLPEPPRGGAR